VAVVQQCPRLSRAKLIDKTALIYMELRLSEKP